VVILLSEPAIRPWHPEEAVLPSLVVDLLVGATVKEQ
jgi:hypothetical protein